MIMIFDPKGHLYIIILISEKKKKKNGRCALFILVGRRRGPRPVEMDVLPLAITAVPDTRFLALLRVGLSLSIFSQNNKCYKKKILSKDLKIDLLVDELSQSDVGDAGCILAHQMDVRIEDERID